MGVFLTNASTRTRTEYSVVRTYSYYKLSIIFCTCIEVLNTPTLQTSRPFFDYRIVTQLSERFKSPRQAHSGCGGVIGFQSVWEQGTPSWITLAVSWVTAARPSKLLAVPVISLCSMPQQTDETACWALFVQPATLGSRGDGAIFFGPSARAPGARQDRTQQTN